MKKKAKKSPLTEIPAWGLSLITVAIPIILGIMGTEFHLFDHSAFEIGFFIFCFIFIVVACFIICRTHPKSVWYTPVICNAVTIIVAIIDPSVLNSPEGIFLVSLVVLSVTGAIIGAKTGRRRTSQT